MSRLDRTAACALVLLVSVFGPRAEAYMKSGDMKKAQENYEKALTLDPKDDNARENLKKIKEIKDR